MRGFISLALGTKEGTMPTKEDPRRYRDARGDAKIGTIEKRIERDYGLPANSVTIVNPDGDDARSDKTVGSLRKDYKG